MKIFAMKYFVLLLSLSCLPVVYADELPCQKDFDSMSPKIEVQPSVSSAMIVHKVLPRMDDFGGKHLHISGTVLIDVLVDQNGKVQCAVAKSGHPMLIARSIEAASKWEFKPYLFQQQPVAIRTIIEFSYKDSKVTAR